MLYAWRNYFQTFLFVILFGIGAYHLVALAERCSNLQSNSKKLIVVARNSSFRVDVRNAGMHYVGPGPPVRGPSQCCDGEGA